MFCVCPHQEAIDDAATEFPGRETQRDFSAGYVAFGWVYLILCAPVLHRGFGAHDNYDMTPRHIVR
jgi:hypothetical protein